MILPLYAVLSLIAILITIQLVRSRTTSSKGSSREVQRPGRSPTPPSTPTPPDRRAQPRRELSLIDKRAWRLWALSLIVTFLLALALAVSLYDPLRWRVYGLESHVHHVIPQIILGLIVLVLLESVYIVVTVRELTQLRYFVMGISAEAAFLAAEFPKDLLTGVLDRRALPDVLKRESGWVDRYRIPLCLVLFDIRNFSKINEQEGNLAGDLVLKDLAQALQLTIRQTDTLLRYGADQFLCLLPRTDFTGGEAFVKRIGKACKGSPRLRDLILDYGIAVYKAGNNVNTVLANAELELARVKDATEQVGAA